MYVHVNATLDCRDSDSLRKTMVTIILRLFIQRFTMKSRWLLLPQAPRVALASLTGSSNDSVSPETT
jgi:hypothetical protein